MSTQAIANTSSTGADAADYHSGGNGADFNQAVEQSRQVHNSHGETRVADKDPDAKKGTGAKNDTHKEADAKKPTSHEVQNQPTPAGLKKVCDDWNKTYDSQAHGDFLPKGK